MISSVVAERMGGITTTAAPGSQLRLIVPRDHRGGRSVLDVVRIEVP